jgi:hypothetical protein
MARPNSGTPRWIAIATALLGLIGGIIFVGTRIYELRKARAEASLAEAKTAPAPLVAGNGSLAPKTPTTPAPLPTAKAKEPDTSPQRSSSGGSPKSPETVQPTPASRQNEDWRRGIEVTLDETGFGRLTVGQLGSQPSIDLTVMQPAIKNLNGAEFGRLKDGRYRITYDCAQAETINCFRSSNNVSAAGKPLWKEDKFRFDTTAGLLILTDGGSLNLSPVNRGIKLPVSFRLSATDILGSGSFHVILGLAGWRQLRVELFPDEVQSGGFRQQLINWFVLSPKQDWTLLLPKQMIDPSIGKGFRIPQQKWLQTAPVLWANIGTPKGGLMSIRRIEIIGDICPTIYGIASKGDDKTFNVRAVEPGSLAEQMGLMKGDVITGINDMTVADWSDWQSKLTKFKLGDSVTVKVARNGKELQLPVVLE